MPVSISTGVGGSSLGIYSIEGVSNPGGNVDLVPSDSITITGNDLSDTIIIGETHSSDLNNPHETKQLQKYDCSIDFKVPNATGIAWLYSGNVATSSCPIVIISPGKLRGASISVDSVDVKDYSLDIIRAGVTLETLTLPAGNLSVSTTSFTTSLAINDKISVRLRRVSGVGSSSFSNVLVSFDLIED